MVFIPENTSVIETPVFCLEFRFSCFAPFYFHISTAYGFNF
jgi:hypothetical protein